MQRIKKFPREWKKIFHCTVHWDYSQHEKVDVNHIVSPFIQTSEWTIFLLYNNERFGVNKPRLIYKTPFGSLLCRFEDTDHWFLFEGGDVDNGCSTCDGITESRYTVREFLCLHDFFYNGLCDSERSEIVEPFWLGALECDVFSVRKYETYQEFRKKVSKNKLKKVLFYLDDGYMDE